VLPSKQRNSSSFCEMVMPNSQPRSQVLGAEALTQQTFTVKVDCVSGELADCTRMWRIEPFSKRRDRRRHRPLAEMSWITAGSSAGSWWCPGRQEDASWTG